ncbi:MAG: hypothetical protein JSV62_03120 [Promethearchaeota archaeon]|nr:MAG: hypothetical protein JSV62_03120 [Candidatus Lokiarchaeota archaeon]
MAKNDDKTNDKPKNDMKEPEFKDKPIYVKVSDDTRALIDKYKEKGTTISDLVKNAVKYYDDFDSISHEIDGIIDKFKEPGESDIKFIERAIKYYGDQKELNRDLWVRARDEMKMMLIGKTTFNQLIHAAEMPEESLQKPWRKNVAIDLILWYNDAKPLKNLSIEEIIKTVQKMWVVANYFHTIDVVKESEDEFHVLFRHRQNKRYSAYWLGYFTELFTSEEMPFKCQVEGQPFDESISMIIKIGYKK